MDDAKKLHASLKRLLGQKMQIDSIWEIGSRDGQDALRLKLEFPWAEFHLFEPNPDTFPLVEEAARELERFNAYNLALGSEDGSAVFQKIDPSKTITSWADGNPGASSFFKASTGYKVETYIQTPVEVEMARASSIIERGIAAPDLIWMDVQGFEGHVVDGFDSHISRVSAIYVELSLREMYEGQILIRDFVKKMSNNFLWVNVQNTGNWQVDALFVNKKSATLRLRILDLFYRLSLKSGINYGVSYDFSAQSIRNATLSLLAKFFVYLEAGDKRALGTFARRLLRISPMKIKASRFGQLLRKVADSSSPRVGLSQVVDLPSIDVIIPAISKDLDVITHAVSAVTHGSVNPISSISLVIPKSQIHMFGNLAKVANLIPEEDLINEDISKALQRLPESRRGWVTQQLVKILFARGSSAAGTLVLDADTVLLNPRVWLDSKGNQILCISREFHVPYIDHYKRFFTQEGHVDGLSFVTHHQLMQPSILRTMFPDDNSISRWVGEISDFGSGASEYHDYGTYMMRNFSSSVALARWGNLNLEVESSPQGVSRIIDWARSHHSDAFSISLHSYNRRSEQ